MMVWLGLYLAAGVVLAVVSWRRGTALVHAVLIVPVWPLMAPFVLGGLKPGFPAPPHLGEVELATLSAGEREAVFRFQRHLAARLEQLQALHRLRAQSNGRITERLDLVERELTRDLEGGRALLEELADRIALAQVATLGVESSEGPDRLRLEALIARADALVHESSSAA